MDDRDKIERILHLLALGAETSEAPELCREAPCLGTPSDIARLIRAGYGGMLCRGLVVGIIHESNEKGIREHRLPMVQLRRAEGTCVMCRRGECLLRSQGLVPAQGRIYAAFGELLDDGIRKLVTMRIVSAWADPANMETVRFCTESLEKEPTGPERNHTN